MILNQKNGNELIHHHRPNSNKKNQLAKFYIPLFEDYKGIILKEPTSMSITIAKTYYADMLVNKLHPKIKKQRRSSISAGVILHHDNVSLRTFFLVSHDLKYELLRRLLYSGFSFFFFVFHFKRLSQRKT